jgi:hypothetical protein
MFMKAIDRNIYIGDITEYFVCIHNPNHSLFSLLPLFPNKNIIKQLFITKNYFKYLYKLMYLL